MIGAVELLEGPAAREAYVALLLKVVEGELVCAFARKQSSYSFFVTPTARWGAEELANCLREELRSNGYVVEDSTEGSAVFLEVSLTEIKVPAPYTYVESKVPVLLTPYEFERLKNMLRGDTE